MLTEQLDWEKTDGMMPAIVQHAVSGEVLMHGYMNKEALEKTEATGKVTFYSRTKQRLCKPDRADLPQRHHQLLRRNRPPVAVPLSAGAAAGRA